MMNDLYKYIDILYEKHTLEVWQYEKLISQRNEDLSHYAAGKADLLRKKHYGNEVYIRGLIEVANVCKNDCLYCGIRKSNKNIKRYVLTKKQILSCCEEGFSLGFKTFVLQSGEGCLPVESICEIISQIRKDYTTCAITLSLGEYTYDEYKMMFDSGANRYLLRHETADKNHYEKLHPKEMSFDNRIRCLYDLKKIGFQVGTGFMVGSPFQKDEYLAKDLKFIEKFDPDMCGIGPFIPQKDTPFGLYPAGSSEKTIFLLSLIRLIKPNILLPATTALGSIDKEGRQKAIAAGANVIMPNLSPKEERKNYALYDNKLYSKEEAAENLNLLKESIRQIGYKIVTARGDIKK